MLHLLLAVFILGSIRGEDVNMETVFAVTKCRAACIDQHAHHLKTEDICKEDQDCTMCWETCEMLHENFEIWGPMCSVPGICLPGCQTACNSLSNNTILSENDGLMHLTVKTMFDLRTMRFTLEWIAKSDPDSETVVLYTVLFRDKGQDWQQIAQTVNHAMHVKGNLMGRTTSIRVLAANASHQIAFAETNYVNSLVLGTEKPVYVGEKDWNPQLVSMVRSDTSSGILATISWPSIPDEFGPNEYEVSWNAVGDPIEVTGHLQTSKNIAVLTLWPDSVYLVTVDRYTSTGIIYGDTTQTLIINTKESDDSTLLQSTSTLSPIGQDIGIRTFMILGWFLAITIIVFILIIYAFNKVKKHVKLYQKKYNVKLPLFYDKINAACQSLQVREKLAEIHSSSISKNNNTKRTSKNLGRILTA